MHRREVIDAVWCNGAEQGFDAPLVSQVGRRIGEARVIVHVAAVRLAADADHMVVALQQRLGEVAAVLPVDAEHQRTAHQALPLANRRSARCEVAPSAPARAAA